MPTPKTHYRIALGELGGQHSWIIHSAKGITWHNIPDELVTLLKRLTVNQLLDFSLGSDGRWYVKYRQKGREKHELSPSLWMDLNQGSNVKLDRLTLGPDADHWGVHRATDGSFQRFRSIGTRDRLARLMDSRTDKLKTNNQIGFVALGFNGDWAFSVHGQVEHRCGKPFQNELTSGKQAQKRVSTVALSSLARLWVIVWEDGTISHNLPINIASQVEDYFQLQHSLKTNGDQSNSGRSKAPKVKPPQNNQPASTMSTQTQQPVPNPTQTTNTAATLSSLAIATQSLARQVSQTTNQQRNVASASGAQTLPKPTPAPPPPVQTAVNTVSVPKAPIAVASTSNQQRNVASASGTQALPKPTLAPPLAVQTAINAAPVPKAPTAVASISNQQRNVASASGTQALPKPTLAAPPAANTTVNAASVPKAPIAVSSTSSQQSTSRPISARYTTLPLVPKAPAITQPAPQAITLTIPQHAPRVASSQANRPISRVETISAKPRVYVSPKKLSTTLRQLDPADWNDSYEYNKIVRLFQDGWKHPHKRYPKIKRILSVSLPGHLNESYQEYKDNLETRNGWNGINENLLFHGTKCSCSLSEGEGDNLCEISSCSLCGILRTSFLLSKRCSAGRTFSRFGSGIYTSSVSSKADDYSVTPSYSPNSFIIVAKVALGKGSIQYRSLPSLTAPPWGYDSVLGEPGIDLNYDDQAVYKNEAIRPAYVIIYERPSSAPPVHLPPKKLSTTLRRLDPFHWRDKSEYDKIVRLFESGWKHPHKQRPKIKRILAVSLADHLNDSYQAYKAKLEEREGWGANEKLLFHGTPRHCSLGEAEGYIDLCESTACRLCLIMAQSFLVSKVCSSDRPPFMRFGSGIYTSSVSSKADDYTNKLSTSNNKVVIVARVALGKGSVCYRTTQHLTEPPDGCDSILGEAGIDLNYDEQVLFKDEAIRPAFVVIYEQPVVSPRFPVTRPTAPRPTAPPPPPPPPPPPTNSSTSGGCIIM